MQSGTVTVNATAGTVIVFPTAFLDIPKVFATPISTGGTFACSAESASTNSFTLRTALAGTINWVAVHTT